jgi:hypothetical protein
VLSAAYRYRVVYRAVGLAKLSERPVTQR